MLKTSSDEERFGAAQSVRFFSRDPDGLRACPFILDLLGRRTMGLD